MSFFLRDYQTEAIGKIIQDLGTHQSTLIECATGLGKTVIFSHLADQWPGRVLVIAHREELIRQAAEKISLISGRGVGIEMGTERANNELYGHKVTVASIQTLYRENRLKRYHPDHFSLIVIDEGHHAAAGTYRAVLEYFQSAKRLFVSATPKRHDKIGLECVCDNVSFQMGIEPAIDLGWLVPVKQVVVQVDGLDFSKARTVAKDFNAADLEAILTAEEPLHRMVSSANELIGQRQALWFCTSINHAQLVGQVLSRYAGEDNVMSLSGKTDKEVRADTVKAYKQGKIQHLLACMLFTEGFDAPSTSAVVMGRPTKSLGLYMQILGRGTRPLPNVVDSHPTPEARRQAIAQSSKPEMLVIDYAGNAGRHKIIQASDVLGGKHPDDVRAEAKANMEREGVPTDVASALARAEAEMALLDEQAHYRKEIKGKATYSTQLVSPFTRQKTVNARIDAPRGDVQYATDKQARYICFLSKRADRHWKYEDAQRLTFKQAKSIIGKLKKETGL